MFARDASSGHLMRRGAGTANEPPWYVDPVTEWMPRVYDLMLQDYNRMTERGLTVAHGTVDV